MIQVQDKIISLDVFEKHFVCDLNACKGACCVEGDSGAPLTKEEEKILFDEINEIRKYLSNNFKNENYEKTLEILANSKKNTDNFFACKVDKDLLSLPIGEHLTDSEVLDIIDKVNDFKICY